MRRQMTGYADWTGDTEIQENKEYDAGGDGKSAGGQRSGGE